MTTSFTGELPFGNGHLFGSNGSGVADAVLCRWQVGGIMALRTGFRFEIVFPGDPRNTQTSNRGNRVGEGKLSNPTIEGWFDQSAFVISKPGIFGNSRRNVVSGPAARGWS